MTYVRDVKRKNCIFHHRMYYENYKHRDTHTKKYYPNVFSPINLEYNEMAKEITETRRFYALHFNDFEVFFKNA